MNFKYECKVAAAAAAGLELHVGGMWRVLAVAGGRFLGLGHGEVGIHLHMPGM